MKSFDTSAIEHQLEENFSKKTRKKMLSAAGPFLLVVTFIEDGMRIFLRWGEQVHYMTAVMRLNYWVGVLFLLISAATQLGSSFLVLRPEAIKPSRVKPACYALLTFVSSQPFMYGQATDVDFMCRSITLAGGLLLLIWSENDRQRRSEMSTGLLQGVQGAGADRLQLCGRLALTFLFLFQALYSENGGLHTVFTKPTFFNVISSLSLLSLSILVCIGFKTEWSAFVLVCVLGISNLWMYPFWSVHERLVDFYKYYFFQTLSVMGGLMLLALHGPGGISLDQGAKKSM
mmetsp:Transcript_41845/g.94522  ORF Transcript_41845/g.94522 Transcript_41845/m.94522 type:complete len:288 (-) Transcript_41845:1024-1887(-)|eukprot:CAMPEP_0181211608 /NCGR_PEP_ID=MMETSP1096-20121128/23888_1 /TAXON_ID=156174 ORGANISM="Chrysochromulina ericina, Strain CCMP281" /NCGR_SAMPLE_ID=MMETSP1096 /ASSEMBLY_ACC=CAM_ASM_000453 /LENGTH=287 /DNA_ID=CAMNT_0023303043 /DNA_START=40 /DNA_END=903 /DNA_ORIENTATION=-